MLPPGKKIFCFDLDGTLAPSKSPIHKETAQLLKELITKGQVFIISGGKLGQFQTQLLAQFFTSDFLNEYRSNIILLPTSGSQQYEYKNGGWVLIDKVALDENVKDKVKEAFKEIINESEKFDIPSDPYGEIVEDRDTQITFSGRGQLAPIQIKTAWDPDQSKRKKIREFLEPKLPEVTLLVNAISSIDVVPKGFNKAVGVQRLLKKINLKKEDLIFVGDGLFPGGNDYSMKEAGFDTIKVAGPEEVENIIKKWLE